MGNIEFDSGTLYILNPNGDYESFGNITEAEELTCSEFADDQSYISLSDLSASFEFVARLSKEAIMALYGIREAVLRCCPNKRVVHLAFHAKKPHTRKKNFNRAIRILEKMKK